VPLPQQYGGEVRFPPEPTIRPETKEDFEARMYAGQRILEKRRAGWARLGGANCDLGVREPEDFMFELEQLSDELNESQAWSTWWSHAQGPHFYLELFIDGGSGFPFGRNYTRRTKDSITVKRVWAAAEIQPLGRADARNFLRDVFLDLARRYQMPPPPPELPPTDQGPTPPTLEGDGGDDGYQLSETVAMPHVWQG